MPVNLKIAPASMLRHALLTILFLACVSPPGTLAAPSTVVSVQLNWRHQYEFAAFYAAIAQGYYREAGLDVVLHEGGPGIDPVDRVVSGSRDFGVANSALAVDYAVGKPVVALAALMQHSAFALLARRDRGINSIADLDGKRISCAAHACDEIRAYLRASGLADQRVHYVSMESHDFDAELTMLDATDIFTSNQGFRLLGREHEFLLLLPRAAGIDLYGDVLFASRILLSANPNLVRAFRAATLKGLHHALTHQDEIIDLILARYNTQGKTREHLAYEARKLYELIRPDLVEPGYMSVGRWRHVRDVYADLGLIQADQPIDGLLYREMEPRWPFWLIMALCLALVTAAMSTVYFRRHNARLQREIIERELAQTALKSGQEQYQRFVEQANSLVAHEVRTPLSVLQVHLDLIELKQSADGELGTHLSIMKQALGRLHRLFERNLKHVFDSAAAFNRQDVIDLGEALQSIVAHHAVLAGEARINLRIDKPSPRVRIAPEMLEPLIGNLLDNAYKYSPAGTPVDVSLWQREGAAIVDVANSTDLPHPAEPERLFSKHVRGTSEDRFPGTGVGLYLVKLIAGSHGGRVSLHLEVPGRFSLRLHLPCFMSDADPGMPRIP